MRIAPYFVLEDIISDCLNKIDGAADCSKGMQGAKVHQIRMNARKIQAGAYLLTFIIRKENGG